MTFATKLAGVLLVASLVSAAQAEDLSQGPYGMTCDFTTICYSDGKCVDENDEPVDLDVWGDIPGEASIVGADLLSDGQVTMTEAGEVRYRGSGDSAEYLMTVRPDMQGTLIRDFGDGVVDRQTGGCEFYS
ncbi:hypothetical protein [Paracoccus albus]|uniref:hypothetical protein n=1 Tax=Paracoccus albus TaxID=3017784 RepID=UPI0022F11166|nr:hypothetical protein [Paracoccus albus]WBU59379.1 hypothetical protein PAF20_11435 [Paracoccus albus]